MPPVQNPQPVPTVTANITVPLSQIDRAPAPVAVSQDPGLQPTGTVPAPVLPVSEQPVSTSNVAAQTNIVVSQPSYLAVDDEGSQVLARTTVLNFTGNGVTVTASGSTAQINITAGAGSYGNSNVTTLLAGFGSNTVSTTGNITAGNLAVTGGSLTWSNAGIVQTSASDLSITGDGQVTVRSLDGTYQWTFDSNGNLTAPGNISTSATITGGNLRTTGLISATGNITGNYFIGNGSQLTGIAANYGNSNVTALLGNLGSAPVSTTGNITAGQVNGNIQAPDGNGSVLINVNGIIGAAAGFSYDTAANALFAPTITADGHPETGVNALYAGVGGYTVLGSSVVVQLTSNVDGYSQINQQNINSGNLASGDYIITADNGTDSTYYLDIGLASSNHADPDFFGDTSTANDGYFYVTGVDQAGPSGGVGNLIVGSTNGVIKLFVGNTAQANVIATVASDGISVTGNIVGVTANNAGSMRWVGNSSGDGGGYTTLRLVPDDTVEAGDQYLILDPTAPGHIHLRAGGTQDASSADLFLGGENTHFKVAAGANSDAQISANSHIWTFVTTGNLQLPSEGNIVGITPNNIGHLQWVGNSSGDGAGYTTLRLIPDDTRESADSYLIIDPTGPSHIHIRAGGAQDASGSELFLGGENSYFKVGAGANAATRIASNGYSWDFGTAGQTVPPVLSVARGDNPSGNISGYTLNLGNGSQEAIITTPDGGEGNPNSQRIVINPGKGADTSSGEGGDIYLWAGRGGDAGGSGGDVKIRGGQGMVNGAGGYIRMEGGDGQGFGEAGYITLDGGTGVDHNGGYLRFRGGYSQNNDGGYIQLQGGYSTNGAGGNVNIIGGGSDGGQSLYGNIGMQSGSQTWTFNNSGNLVLPSQGNIVGITANNTGHLQWVGNSSGDGGGYTTLRLVPDDTVESGDQYLIIDPTGGGHIHLRAGGTQDSSNAILFIGGENSYVSIGSGSNPPVTIAANNHSWSFGVDSQFSAAGNIYTLGEVRSGSTVTPPLPLANLTATAGSRAFASDANLVAAGNFGQQVSGGAGNTVPVWSDGTNWYIG